MANLLYLVMSTFAEMDLLQTQYRTPKWLLIRCGYASRRWNAVAAMLPRVTSWARSVSFRLWSRA